MTGQQLSNSRRLNRHWQSVKKKAAGELIENLIWYDNPTPIVSGGELQNPGIFAFPEASSLYRLSADVSGDLGQQADFTKPIVITRPGKYQLKWDLVGYVDDAEVSEGYTIPTENTLLTKVMMYAMAENAAGRALGAKEYDSESTYIGKAYNYIAGDATTHSGSSTFVEGITQWVSPFRTTGGLFSAATGLEIDDYNTTPPITFNIPYGAPFMQYSGVSGGSYLSLMGRYSCPDIKIQLYGRDGYPEYTALFGRIWLERIGDYVNDGQFDAL